MAMIPLLATHATDGDWVSWTTVAAQARHCFWVSQIFRKPTLLTRRNRITSDGMVVKSHLRHCRWIKQIAAVENNRRGHFLFHHGEINVGKFLPFRCNNEGLGPFDCFDGSIAKAGRLDFRDLAGPL